MPVLQHATPPSNRRGPLKHRGYCVKRERKHKDSDKQYFQNHQLQPSLLINPSTQDKSSFNSLLCPPAVIMLPPSRGVIHGWQEVGGLSLVLFRYKEVFSAQPLFYKEKNYVFSFACFCCTTALPERLSAGTACQPWPGMVLSPPKDISFWSSSSGKGIIKSCTAQGMSRAPHILQIRKNML